MDFMIEDGHLIELDRQSHEMKRHKIENIYDFSKDGKKYRQVVLKNKWRATFEKDD
jgi:hypothetical protein